MNLLGLSFVYLVYLGRVVKSVAIQKMMDNFGKNFNLEGLIAYFTQYKLEVAKVPLANFDIRSSGIRIKLKFLALRTHP